MLAECSSLIWKEKSENQFRQSFLSPTFIPCLACSIYEVLWWLIIIGMRPNGKSCESWALSEWVGWREENFGEFSNGQDNFSFIDCHRPSESFKRVKCGPSPIIAQISQMKKLVEKISRIHSLSNASVSLKNFANSITLAMDVEGFFSRSMFC